MLLLEEKMKSLAYGGDGGIRTPDLHVANVALSQLSYIPVLLRKVTRKEISVN